MNVLRPLILLVTLLSGIVANAQNIPIKYIESTKIDGLEEKLKEIHFLSGLSRENYAGAVEFVASVSKTMTASGTGANVATVLLSAGSLGIIPVVDNKDVALTFEVRLHGSDYAEYKFVKNFSDVQNFWVVDANRTSPAVMEWAVTMVDELRSQLQEDPRIDKLQEDYTRYFPDS